MNEGITKVFYTVVASLLVMGVGAGGTAVVKAYQNETKIESQKELLIETRNDVKWIRGKMEGKVVQ